MASLPRTTFMWRAGSPPPGEDSAFGSPANGTHSGAHAQVDKSTRPPLRSVPDGPRLSHEQNIPLEGEGPHADGGDRMQCCASQKPTEPRLESVVLYVTESPDKGVNNHNERKVPISLGLKSKQLDVPASELTVSDLRQHMTPSRSSKLWVHGHPEPLDDAWTLERCANKLDIPMIDLGTLR